MAKKESQIDLTNQSQEVILYQVDDTNICVSVIMKDETFWLSQKAMGELFDCSSDNISLHLKNIYEDEELDEISTTEDFSVVHLSSLEDTVLLAVFPICRSGSSWLQFVTN